MHRLARAVVLGVSLLAATTVLPLSTASPAGAASQSVATQWRGAQLHVLWDGSSDSQITTQLDQLVAMHANSARLDVSWSSLEIDGRGQWSSSYIASVDSVIDGMSARGIKPVIVLTTTPCWASTAPESLKLGCTGDWWNRGVTSYAPSDPAYFAEAAAWVAGRWGDKLAGLELWNEPNYDEGGLVNLIAKDKAATYTAMVKAAYPAVKAVAPDLPVLAGATSFVDVPFLQQMWADGAAGYFDGISVHPYNEWRAPGAPHDVAWAKYDLVQGLDSLRSAMAAAGVDVPIWITEFGYTSCTIGADRWCVTEKQQADYLAKAARLVATWPWVKSFLIYNLRDKGNNADSTEDNFGLDRHDLTPKPAFDSVASAFGDLADGSTDTSVQVAETLDHTAPAVHLAPRHLFGRHSRLAWAWSGHDRGSGVASYDVRYRVARWGGRFGRYITAQHATRARRMVLDVARGDEMCVSVRARDRAGNLSAWTPDECKATVLDDRSMSTRGPWTRAWSGRFVADTGTITRAAGATVQRRDARGRMFSLVATRCPTCGHVDVWVGGRLIARNVSLFARHTEYRQMIHLPALHRVVTGTVRVRSSDSGRTVSIDGFGARRG